MGRMHKFEIGFSGNSAKKNGFDDPAFSSFFADFYLKNPQNIYMRKNWHKKKEKRNYSTCLLNNNSGFEHHYLINCGFRHRNLLSLQCNMFPILIRHDL